MLRTIKNAPRRIARSLGYSFSGLRQAFGKEESLRIETLFFMALAVALAFIPWPLWKKTALVAAYCLIPLAELVNSCIEDLCDLIKDECHPVIKNIKDMGAAAVFLAIVTVFLTLVALILA